MADKNHVELEGNLIDEPHLGRTNGGHDICNFLIATQTGKSGRNEVHKCIVMHGLALKCADALKKGHRVLVEGRISNNTKHDEDGREITTADIFTTRVLRIKLI